MKSLNNVKTWWLIGGVRFLNSKLKMIPRAEPAYFIFKPWRILNFKVGWEFYWILFLFDKFSSLLYYLFYFYFFVRIWNDINLLEWKLFQTNWLHLIYYLLLTFLVYAFQIHTFHLFLLLLYVYILVVIYLYSQYYY